MPAKKSAGARFEPASDQSLLVYFGEQITLEANENVRRLLHLLEQEPIPGVDNLHPAYCSLLVKFAALKWRHQDRKSTRLNSSHGYISYAVFCLKKKKKIKIDNLSFDVAFFIAGTSKNNIRQFEGSYIHDLDMFSFRHLQLSDTGAQEAMHTVAR